MNTMYVFLFGLVLISVALASPIDQNDADQYNIRNFDHSFRNGGYDRKLLRADYEWLYYFGVNDGDRFNILESLVKAKENEKSGDKLAGNIQLQLNSRIKNYNWGVIITKTIDSVIGNDIQYDKVVIVRYDADVYYLFSYSTQSGPGLHYSH